MKSWIEERGTFARCSRAESLAGALQEIPVWMRDTVTCGAMRAVVSPEAALSAVAALRRLLSEAMVHAGMTVEQATETR